MAATEMWTYTTETPGVDLSRVNLTGYKVEATDGSIDKVDEATHEVGGSFIIVDTGPWIFGKKVMLPAGVIRDVDLENETAYVHLSKDEIKDAPEFDEQMYRDPSYRNQIGEYYSGRMGSRTRERI